MRKLMLATALAVALPATLPSAAYAQPGWGDDRGHVHGNRGDHGDHGDRGGLGRPGDGGRDGRWNGDRNGGWDPSQHYQGGNFGERRLGRNDRIYRGGDGRYYCRRSNGTTGLVIGAIGGGLLGGAIGGNTLGALLGAGGGALLGRSVDRGNVRCR